jgi:chorismate dehydratase
MLSIALVEYINTRPFLDGLEAHFGPDEIELLLLPPADCARALQDGRADLALMPVGALPHFDHVKVLPDFCIGANGPVHSVFLFAQQPIETLDTVLLDRHSRSSNGLARVLLHHYWQQPVNYLVPDQKHFDRITGSTGGVVIGDQAIRIRDQYAYAYDLSEAWQQLTGLPFAFAVWVYRPGALDQSMKDRLYAAMLDGVTHPAETADRWHAYFDLDRDFSRRYLSTYIDFRFTPAKHQALRLYYQALVNLPELALQVV